MARPNELPADVVLVRTTDVFDEHTVPAGLLRAHQIGAQVWGRLVVQTGSLSFTFEDQADASIRVAAGGSVVIPPLVRHHVTLDGPVRFSVEFHRRHVPDDPQERTQ